VDEAAFLAQRAIVLTRRPARVASTVTLDLPAERRGALRSDPAFFAAVRDLRARLESAEASR
jgi:NitT/TauT family transport system ATP-binding protein